VRSVTLRACALGAAPFRGLKAIRRDTFGLFPALSARPAARDGSRRSCTSRAGRTVLDARPTLICFPATRAVARTEAVPACGAGHPHDDPVVLDSPGAGM
jgi:hypothetical protein